MLSVHPSQLVLYIGIVTLFEYIQHIHVSIARLCLSGLSLYISIAPFPISKARGGETGSFSLIWPTSSRA